MRILAVALALAFVAGAMPVGPARAQDKFPSSPITLVVPVPPGGGTDVLARQLADVVEPLLGVPVIVKNVPGSGGVVGTNAVVNAKPDGYTLALTFNGALTTIPATRQVPYSSDAYEPIIQIGYNTYVMCVAPGFPATSGKEFLEELRRNPEKYTYGNDGLGNNMQLAAERIFQHFGIKARPVPLGGAGETAKLFLGGHIDIYGGSVPPIMPHVAAGKAKCLLLSSANERADLPLASGLRSLGIPELETGFWYVVIGPKGLRPEIVDKLYNAFKSAAESPRIKQTLAGIGADPVIRGPTETKALIARERKDLGEVARQLGLRVEN